MVRTDKNDARYDWLRFLVGQYKLRATHPNLSALWLYFIVFVLLRATSLNIVIFQKNVTNHRASASKIEKLDLTDNWSWEKAWSDLGNIFFSFHG